MLRRPPTAITARPVDVQRLQSSLASKGHPKDRAPKDEKVQLPEERDALLAIEEEERRVRDARTRDERIGI